MPPRSHDTWTVCRVVLQVLPELALELLQAKSRFEYRWWGNDLYWFSFSGVVLGHGHTDSDGAAAVSAGETSSGPAIGTKQQQQALDQQQQQAAAAAGAYRPLAFKSMSGRPATIEQLILRHERKELLETPVSAHVHITRRVAVRTC